jgi:hypothetical protein
MTAKVEALAKELVALSDEEWDELLEKVRQDREEREESLAWLRLAESSAAKDWDNERDAVYDNL